MSVKGKLTIGVGALVAMIIFLVVLSIYNLQVLTAAEPDSIEAEVGLQRALVQVWVVGAVCVIVGLVMLFLFPRSVNRPIEERDKAKTTFISTVSHELKTPISAVLMSVNLLEDSRVGDLNSEQQQLIAGIRDNGERLLSITGELLNLTRIESGKLQLNPSVCNPLDMIEYAMDANKIQADQKGVKFEVDYPDNLTDKLFVDGEKLTWVLTNLIGNAVRYSYASGRVLIGARQQNDNFVIFVRDYGVGIDPAYHSSIFDHYFRVPGNTASGSGLGLSISKEFVQAHSGTLTVESAPGQGSTFYIKLNI